MKFSLNIDCDNSAFEEILVADEVARILKEVAEKVASGETSGTVRDINGNRVGSFSF